MQRLPEIDIARGCAIIMMIISNFVTDLQYFFNYSVHEIFWYWFARVTATVFIFLVGVSLVLSYKRTKGENKSNFRKYLKRGSFIFFLGLLITIATYVFIPQDYVQFGVLHLIGIAIIIGYFFVKAKNNYLSLIFGILFVIIGIIFSNISLNTNTFSIFGLTSQMFSSVDYFPIFPWLGVALLGIFSGRILYRKMGSVFHIENNYLVNLFTFLGRKSLLIYFVHQPILLGILFLL